MKIYLNKFVSAQEKERVIQESKKILAHRFEILCQPVRFSQKINWHTNFAGKSWPILSNEELNQHYLADFDSPKYIGDVKLAWELNKHLHLQDLVKAYLLTGEEKLTREFINELQDWLKKNPFGYGVNWTQGLIAGHRAISWAITLSVFRQSPLIQEDFLAKIFSSLYQHALFIEKTYEFGLRATNHLLSELCAQIFLSVVFPDFKDSKKRLDFAVKHLEDELAKQIYADGVDYEQSSSYQRVTLEFLYLPLILAKRGLVKLPESIIRITEKMTEFMLHMTQPNGLLQPISDADGARVFVLGQDINDFRPHLALAAWLFNRGDFKYVSESKTDQIAWFLSPHEIKEFQQIQSFPPKKNSVAFPRGGYWILRKEWNKDSPWLFFDCGWVGMGEWPKDLIVGLHGHSDILNFGLALGDETFITDKGSYSYTTERPFHQYFRSAWAHNLPLVDNEDQNIIEPQPWLSRQEAKPQNQKHYFSKDFDYLAGEHTGYLRLSGKIITRREILYEKNQKLVIIKDSFLGSGTHNITEFFHLMPKLQVKEIDAGYLITGKKHQLTIESLKRVQKEIVIGRVRPVEGWYAPTYGTKEKAPVLKFHFQEKLPASIYFVLSWRKQSLVPRDLIALFEQRFKKIRKPKIVMLVTNDVYRDPRVQKEAQSAQNNGFEAEVIAYYLSTISPIALKEEYKVHRYQHQPFNLKQKIQGWLGRKMLNLYHQHKFLAITLSYVAEMRKILRLKVIKMVDYSINSPGVEPVKSNSKRAAKSKFNLIALVYFYWRLNKKLVQEGARLHPDIVHANDLDTLMAGWLIKRKTGAKLVYDAHEIWWEQGLGLPKILIWLFKKMEKFLFKKIDAFISVNQSVSEVILQNVQKKFPTEIVYNSPPYSKSSGILHRSKTILALYQGLFIPNRGLEQLIEASKYLNKNIEVIIRGYGYQDFADKLKDLAKNAAAGKVTIADPISPDRMVQEAKKADIGVIVYLPTNLNNRFCTPNKLYEYMMAGLALVVSDLPELKKVIQKYQNGLLVNSQSPQSIARAINKLAKNPKLLSQMKKNSLLAAKEYNWENQETKLIKVYRELISPKEQNLP